MKIETKKEPLLKLAGVCSQALGLKPSLPVLNNFLVRAEKGAVELVATNLDTTIAGKVAVKVIEEGGVTMPARTFVSFCQASAGENIEIEEDKEGVKIKSGGARARLSTIATTEFPSISEFKVGESLELARGVFIDAVSQVAVCASPEEGRPTLTGILLKGGSKSLDFVATDGYRLGKKEVKASQNFNAILPARALVDAARAFADQDDELVDVSINKEKNQVKIKTRLLSVTTRLIDGEYPNYEQIIPTSFPSSSQVLSKELTEAVRLAAIFAKDVGSVVSLETGEGGMVVSANTSQVGEAQSRLPAKNKGEKIKVAFNSRFLLDSLSAIKKEKIEINFSGSASAARLTGVDDESLVHVVMPVRSQS